jgi:hypothetical protein
MEAGKELNRVGYGGIWVKKGRQPVCPKIGIIELEIIGSIVGSQFGTIGKRKEFSVACTCVESIPGGARWQEPLILLAPVVAYHSIGFDPQHTPGDRDFWRIAVERSVKADNMSDMKYRSPVSKYT